MQDGWNPIPGLLAGGYGVNVNQFIAVVERPVKPKK